jgi:hypothetical protein
MAGKEKITLCGDNCQYCPRCSNNNEEDLKRTAELWYEIGMSETLLSIEQIRCNGCSSHVTCTYHLRECIAQHHIAKCNQCPEYPCQKISDMLAKSDEYQKKAEEVCSMEEYQQLCCSFFHKRENLDK